MLPAVAVDRFIVSIARTLAAMFVIPVDGGESSVWLRPPSLVAGGGGLVSTARDFARFTGMLLGRGTFDGVQVLREDIARLACSDLLPPEVALTPGLVPGCESRRSRSRAHRNRAPSAL